MRSQLLLLACCSGCWSAATLPPPVELAEVRASPKVLGPYARVAGDWTGHGVQYDDNSDWDIDVTLSANASLGEVIGHVEYPGLGCGGDLIRRPEHEDGTLVLLEKITHDSRGNGCIDGGRFQFPSTPTGTAMAFTWFMPRTDDEEAAGTLHRK